MNDKSFTDDYDQRDKEPAPHEKASAVIVLKEFRDAIVKCNGDPKLICRMILGCKHRQSPGHKELLQNCLIELLNSTTIDVDKLDYILRDTWASGVNNISIDIERLLSSLTIVRDNDGVPRLAFNKSALSVVQNVVEARNYLYRWVYGHHKVVYFHELLRRATEALAECLSPANSQAFLSEFFSVDRLLTPKTVEGVSIFLPSDGDITYLLKRFFQDIPEARELLSQKAKHPLWKSYGEYKLIFENISDQQQMEIMSQAEAKLPQFWSHRKNASPVDIWVLEPEAKIRDMKSGSIYIVIDGDPITYGRIFSHEREPSLRMFYVYGPADLVAAKQDVLTFIRSLVN